MCRYSLVFSREQGAAFVALVMSISSCFLCLYFVPAKTKQSAVQSTPTEEKGMSYHLILSWRIDDFDTSIVKVLKAMDNKTERVNLSSFTEILHLA